MNRSAARTSLLLVIVTIMLHGGSSMGSDNAQPAGCRPTPSSSPFETERDALMCMGIDESRATFIAHANVDVRQAHAESADLVSTHAHLLSLDRQAKVAAFTGDAGYRIDYAAGDDDGDLVPNRRDRCPDTPARMPTDSEGCGYDCDDLGKGPSRLVTPAQCLAVLGPPGQLQIGRVLALEVPVNLGCVETPAPATSAPLGWSAVILESGVLQPGTYIERLYEIHGLRFFVVRTEVTGAKCELFYEFDAYTNVGGVTQGTGFMFSTNDDISADHPDIATFQIATRRIERDNVVQTPPWPHSVSAATAELPLSPGRAKARDLFTENAEVFWRVRAIDGMGKTGGWSEYRKHGAGPNQTN